MTQMGELRIISKYSEEAPSKAREEHPNITAYKLSRYQYEELKAHVDAINNYIPDFRWGLIPESETEKIKKMILVGDLVGLLEVHDQYKVSSYDYGCCGLEGLLNRFKSHYGKK